MPGIVVIIVMNSQQQLYGGVNRGPGFVSDVTVWTTRFIPYIMLGVFNYMKREPGGKPC